MSRVQPEHGNENYVHAFGRLCVPIPDHMTANDMEVFVARHKLYRQISFQLQRQAKRIKGSLPDMPHRLSPTLWRWLCKHGSSEMATHRFLWIRRFIQHHFREPSFHEIAQRRRIDAVEPTSVGSVPSRKALLPTRVRIGIHLHVGDRVHMLGEFMPLLKHVRDSDVCVEAVVITTFERLDAKTIMIIRTHIGGAVRVINDVVPNQGFDIMPFLHAAKKRLSECDIIFKWHTKSDDSLRVAMHQALFGSPLRVLIAVNMLCGTHPHGIVCPKDYVVKWPGHNLEFVDNWAWLENLTATMRMPPFQPHEMQFVANTIFAVRRDCIAPLLDEFSSTIRVEWFNHELRRDWSWFARETNTSVGPNFMTSETGRENIFQPNQHRDGMIEHAVERLFGFLATRMFGDPGEMPTSTLDEACDLRLLAVYFPQFHAFETNDRLWGKGFTEWTMLQPHAGLPSVPLQKPLPAEQGGLGTYDLTHVETRKRQGELAAQVDLGFLIYHYWFGEEAIMDAPLLKMLEDGEPDRPFAFQWANERWSRRWDGSDADILVDQDYGDERTWQKHYDYLLPFFRHKNYMQIDGCPVFSIYRFGDLPVNSQDAMIALWRQNAIDDGFQGVHILANLGAFEDSNQKSLACPGVDSFFCFQPMYSNGQYLGEDMVSIFASKHFDPKVYLENNPDLVNCGVADALSLHKRFSPKEQWMRTHKLPFRSTDTIPGVKHSMLWEHRGIHKHCIDLVCKFDREMTRPVFFGTFDFWNNHVRRSGKTEAVRPVVFNPVNEERLAFETIFRSSLAAALAKHFARGGDGPCLFVFNAWNEWNEQAILEPDHINKTLRLDAIQVVLRETKI